jgi:hypothetical protein
MDTVYTSLATICRYTVTHVLAGIMDSTVIWGPPGCGKTESMHMLKAMLEAATGNSWGLMDRLRNTQLSELDYRGLPFNVEVTNSDGTTRMETIWIPPNFLPNADRDGEFGILVIDEGFAGRPAVLAAMMQLVNERALGDYTLPPGWIVVLLTNRQKDKSGVAANENYALLNRFSHYEAEVNLNEWCGWAQRDGVDPRYIAFMRYRSQYLHEFPDGFGSEAKGRTAWASPRTNTMFAARCTLGYSDSDLINVGTSLVGEPIAREAVGFLSIYRDLPDLEAALANPADFVWPHEPSIVYAFCGVMARHATGDNLGAILTLLDRVSEEYADCTIRDAIARDENLKFTEPYIQFIADNQHLHF